MRKLDLLRDHILASALNLKADDLLIFADQGKVVSFEGDDNQNFMLRYAVNIILTDFTGEANSVFYILLQWLKLHQPNHKPDDLSFEVDILKHGVVDLAFKLNLTETITAREAAEGEPAGTYLTSVADPNPYEIYVKAPDWTLTVTHNPDGPPES